MPSHTHWFVLFCVRVLLLLDSQLPAVHGQDAPVMILGPDQVTGTLEIVSGSTIQLFCSATSTSGVAPDVSWVRNGMTLENTPPSIYFRTSSDSSNTTSSVLTIKDFQSVDDGTYFCSSSIPANDSGTIGGSSGTAELTAVSFNEDNSNAVELTRDPISREDRYDVIADNRVSVAVGSQFDPASTANADQLMVAAAALATFRNLETQSIVWVKDGVVIAENGVFMPTMVDPITADPRYTIDATATDLGGSGLWRTVLTISNFQASDAGVYQVIFTDAAIGGSEVLTTTPIRLDADEPAVLVTVSSAVIDLVLGEPLLIEVSASGGYSQISWMRNGVALSGTFVSHDEVYYTAGTTSIDLGAYSITAAGGSPTVTVAVLPYTTPTVNILNTMIEVMEGGSVNITCTSTGIPTPTIEWELVSGSLPFTPVDAALVDPMIAQVSPLMFNEGSLTSVLPITNAVFPDHQGTYRCTGANTRDRAASSNNDTVQVTVLVTPEVQVSATRTRILLGGTVNLTCTVTRSNPSNSYTYTWTLLPATAVSGPTASTQSTDMLEVTFDMEADYGTYRCSVQNDVGLVGTADIVIEQGYVASLTTALFQLRILPVGDCATWVVDSPDQKFQEIISTVVDAVSMMCSCTFTRGNIQNNEFSCRSIENTVVFRAEITYTSFTYTAAQLVDFISQWVQSAPSFVVGPSMSRVNVDTNCPTQLDSFLSDDCVSVDQRKSQSIGAIVGGVLTGVGVVLIFAGIIIAVIKRKRKSYSHTPEESEISQNTVIENPDPVYENINPLYGPFPFSTYNRAVCGSL